MSSRPEALRKRAYFTTLWVRSILRSFAIFRISNVKTINRGNVPKKGAVIVAPNHLTLMDAPYVWGSLRRRAAPVAKHTLWSHPIGGLLLTLLGGIPIKRGDKQSGNRARAKMSQTLKAGGLVMIFPEGRCAPDPQILGRFYPGAAEMAVDHDCPIVPCVLKGIEKVLPLGSKRLRLRRPVQIVYLDPMHPADFGYDAEALNTELRARIAKESGQQLAPLD